MPVSLTYSIVVLFLFTAVLAAGLIYLLRKLQGIETGLHAMLEAFSDKVARLEGDVASNREGQAQIMQLLQELTKSGKSAKKRDLDAVTSEVRVLQRLVEQLAKTRPVGGGIGTAIMKEGRMQDVPAKEAPVIRTDLGRDEILHVVESALRTERVDLYIQPIVSLPQRKHRHFECLSRIRDEKGGIILPDQYLKVAEQEGLISAIDNMLLFRCVQLVRRANLQNFHGSFFCNVSNHTLRDKSFFEDFVEYLRENDELASKLVFEIEQKDYAARDVGTMRLFRDLTNAGCRLALASITDMKIDVDELDQAGFGYIKVEIGALQRALKSNPPFDLTMMRRSLNSYEIDLIVERVEDEDQLLQLLEYDIDYGQGYLFGEPKLSKGQ